MFTINIRSNANEIVRQFRETGHRKIRSAIKVAINSTAHAVRQAARVEMSRAFDRPTPYTLNSLFLKYATDRDLSAVVWLKDERAAGKGTPATKYLAPQIEGGARRMKRFERALKVKGLLPDGMFAVPGAGAKLDAYGNMSRGLIVQILSALGAAEINRAGLPASGYDANRTASSIKRRGKKLAQFFVGRPGGGRLPLGVWQRSTSDFGRKGGRIRPVLIFVKALQYKARFRYFEVAEATVKTEFPRRLRDALNALPV